MARSFKMVDGYVVYGNFLRDLIQCSLHSYIFDSLLSNHIDSLMQNCGNVIANALMIPVLC